MKNWVGIEGSGEKVRRNVPCVGMHMSVRM